MNKFRVRIPITRRERFVRSVYASMDQAVADRLKRLRVEEDIRPSCAVGCCHCCRYYILTNLAEAHTLAQYIKREWKKEQINDLRNRTEQWHAWDHSRPGRGVSAVNDKQIDLSEYEAGCPLLVHGACNAYPVRPAVCRSHFISDPPLSCQAANLPGTTGRAPLVLASIVAAVDPFRKIIRDHVEKAGWDYDRTRMLLPQWLAIEMGWDFGLSR
jgi:Fe-S-cluster containining protein